MSRAGAIRPRVTSCILLNKWQRQKEKDFWLWLEEEEYQHQQEKERYERVQVESHWNCPFFGHCWNEGLKLPARIVAQNTVINTRSLGNLGPTIGLSMIELSINIMMWTSI
jgi:hypothetical protein